MFDRHTAIAPILAGACRRRLLTGTAIVALATGPSFATDVHPATYVPVPQTELPLVWPSDKPSPTVAATPRPSQKPDTESVAATQMAQGRLSVGRGSGAPGLDGEEIGARESSVFGRARPEYDAIGIDPELLFGNDSQPAPAYLLYPQLIAAIVFDDNVFRAPDNTESDGFLLVQPQLTLESNWANHFLQVAAGAEIDRYFEADTNDSTTYFGSLRGRYDIDLGSYVEAFVRGGKETELRSDPNAPPGTENVNEFRLVTAVLTGRYQGAQGFAQLRLTANQIDYNDNGTIENDDRDRNEFELAGIVGYEFLPETRLLVEAGVNMRAYHLDRDVDGLDRDSSGYYLRGGLLYTFSSVTSAEVTVGYFSQDYDDPLLETATGISFNGELVWNPTEVMSVGVQLGREIQATTLPFVSGIVTSSANAGLDYEVTEQILLGTEFGIARQGFRGVERRDTILNARGGVTYFVNEYVALEGYYAYGRRNSDLDLGDYAFNRVLLRLRFQV